MSFKQLSESEESEEDFTSNLLNFTFPSTSKGFFKYGFNFPPPPTISKSADNSCCCSSQSDSSARGSATSLECNARNKKRNRADYSRKLPPLGIYWDIENVRVPKMKNASVVVQRLREVFLKNYRESEFVVVCDVKKENAQLIQELHDSQVSLIHVSSTSKNAADDKLRQYLRRFAELHPAPSGILLISGDVNFAADLSDLRYRRKVRVILVHNVNVADALILCANEHHSFTEMTEDIPLSTNKKGKDTSSVNYLTVSNLPKNIDAGKIRGRLHNLTSNCGGKCIEVFEKEGIASLKFSSFDYAFRAQKRIQGEDVFGNKIKVLPPSVRSYSGRKLKNQDGTYRSLNSSLQNPSFIQNQRDLEQNSFLYGQFTNRDQRFPQDVSYHQPIHRGPSPIFGTSSAGPTTYDPQVSYFKQPIARSVPDEQLASFYQAPSYGRVHKISGSSEFSDFDEKPATLSYNEVAKRNSHQPVELNITNLDSSIDVKELRRLLTNLVKEYAMILSLSVQADGSPVANLKVSSQQEAQFIISQLHRQKLGHKRIVISYAQSNQNDPEQLRAMVISVLQEVPDKSMPLFKFMELLESRFQCTVSVSDVNKLRDVVKISDNLGSRIISLTRELKNSFGTNLTKAMVPHCITHCPMGIQNRGWCELGSAQIPNVMMSLSHFTSKLIGLLNFHEGSMPLLSFQACYEQVYRESLPVSDSGVPLEHLITCVPNIDIKLVGSNKNIKIIVHDGTSKICDEDSILKSVAPSLAPNITLLCRELVDLLKTTEKCQLLLTKFIPAYHHHFGRQCRVADYGYTKLLDLFESISHVIQIMGDGTRRVITLTHTAQIRRFTSDLLRILKVQPARQITATDFPGAYEKSMNRPFSAVEYGLCTFEDLLQEVPESTLVISKNEGELIISVPKREQTADEIMRTKQFANEIDELPDGERTVSLTVDLSMKILCSQLTHIIRTWSHGNGLNINDLASLYFREYGYPLKPDIYQCVTVEEIIEKLSDFIQVSHTNSDTFLSLIEVDSFPNILRVRSWILLLQPPHCMDLQTFNATYKQHFNNINLESLKRISDMVSISLMDSESYISLTVVYVLAAQLYHVIVTNGGSVLFGDLERLYQEAYGKPLMLSGYNIRSINEFYNQFNLLFYVRGSKRRSVIVLNRSLLEHLNSTSVPRKTEEPPKEEKAPLWLQPGTSIHSTPTKNVIPPNHQHTAHAPNFSINMPISHNPTLLGNADCLISPARYLLPVNQHWCATPPDPVDLPMPNKFLAATDTSAKMSDESGDSGVNVRLESSHFSDDEIEINMPRRKVLGYKRSLFKTST